MDTLISFCDLRGPPKPSLRTPRGSMDSRLRTHALAGKIEYEDLKKFKHINFKKKLTLSLFLESLGGTIMNS